MRSLYTTLFLLVLASCAWAQTPTDTSAKDATLLPVLVTDSLQGASLTQLPDVNGSAVYAGRKTEVITISKINANVALQNPRELFGRIPGANIWEIDGTGIQLSIATRGLSPNRLWEFNVRMNGYDISADPLGYPEAYFTPPIEAVERVELVRGAASLQYGPQFGGLLNFRTKQPEPNKTLGGEVRLTGGSYGLLNAFARVGGTLPSGKLRYQLIGQYRRADGWRPNSGYQLGYAQGLVEYSPNNRISAALDLTWMRTRQQQSSGLTDAAFAENADQSVRARNWFSLDWYVPALRVKYAASEHTTISWNTFGTIGYRNSVGFNGAINVADDNGLRNVQKDIYENIGSELRLLQAYTLGGAEHTLSTGLRYYRGHTDRKQGLGTNGTDANYNFNSPTDLQSFDYSLPLENIAAFAENVFQVLPKLKVVPGIRYERILNEADGYYKSGGTRYPDQRQVKRDFVLLGISVSYKATASMEAYGGVSQSYRPVTFNDTRVSNPGQRVDPNLEDARGYTASVGLRGRLQGVLSYDVSAFYLRYNNRIGAINSTENGAAIQLTTNVADARSQGIESYLELDIAKAFVATEQLHLSIFNSTAFVEANYIGAGDSIRSGNANISVEGKRLESAPKWTIRTGLTAGYGGFQATLQHSYTTIQYSDAFNTESTANSANGRIPMFRVWDLSGRYRWARFEMSGGANNLLNARYFTRRSGNNGLLPGEARTLYLGLAYQL